MITAVVRDIDYEQFQLIRDTVFEDSGVLMGTISADYSPLHRTALFSFISDVYLPDILKEGPYKAVLTYFPHE